jgi:hypothetical protein
MTAQLDELRGNLDFIHLAFVHLWGALERYSSHFQRTGGRLDHDIIHDGVLVASYRGLNVAEHMHRHKQDIAGFIALGCVLRTMSDLDHYFAQVLTAHYFCSGIGSNSWETFCVKTGIDLLGITHGRTMYMWLQLRHKLAHTAARIDQVFLDRMVRKGIAHDYRLGEKIVCLSHTPVVLWKKACEFAESVDREVVRTLGL